MKVRYNDRDRMDILTELWTAGAQLYVDGDGQYHITMADGKWNGYSARVTLDFAIQELKGPKFWRKKATA